MCARSSRGPAWSQPWYISARREGVQIAQLCVLRRCGRELGQRVQRRLQQQRVPHASHLHARPPSVIQSTAGRTQLRCSGEPRQSNGAQGSWGLHESCTAGYITQAAAAGRLPWQNARLHHPSQVHRLQEGHKSPCDICKSAELHQHHSPLKDELPARSHAGLPLLAPGSVACSHRTMLHARRAPCTRLGLLWRSVSAEADRVSLQRIPTLFDHGRMLKADAAEIYKT